MSALAAAVLPPATDPHGSHGSARDLYRALWDASARDTRPQGIEAWLDEQLSQAGKLRCPLPEDPAALHAWMDGNVDAVGQAYAAYRARRAAGGRREMFANRSHALYFLAHVGPTKRVDGAWLYGLLSRAGDPRLAALVNTYLEELGDGDPAQNHVTVFRELLRRTGADSLPVEEDDRYVQGAVQMALGACGMRYVPEVIGFNLGYEQLPLHLQISAYELDELGIDPFYFTVHITVDNADSGHARQAVDTVLAALPSDPVARQRFYTRVRRGFMLNELGIGSTAIARAFDLEQSVVGMMARKARYGKAAHADTCRIAGRSVNEWLAGGEACVPGLLQALQDAKWIVRHRDPAESRFWKLLHGPHAEMFGVFGPAELQLLYDWIAGDCPDYLPGPAAAGAAARPLVGGRHLSYRAQRRLEARRGAATQASEAWPAEGPTPQAGERDPDYDAPADALSQACAHADDALARLALLRPYLAPARHHTQEGLHATRLFSTSFRAQR